MKDTLSLGELKQCQQDINDLVDLQYKLHEKTKQQEQELERLGDYINLSLDVIRVVKEIMDQQEKQIKGLNTFSNIQVLINFIFIAAIAYYYFVIMT